MNTAKRMRKVLESRRTCATCPEMDNPDSYIRHLQSALKWHDEHVPRPTNPKATCVVLQGERSPEEVLFVREDGEVTHYLPEESVREHEELSRRLEHATEMNSMLIGMSEHDRMQIASMLTSIDGINLQSTIRELEAENAKLRAERDYLLANSNPTATELRRVRSAWKKDRDENAKLREQVVQLKNDWESERDYADQMEANEKKAVSENAKLRVENVKLRQLVADMCRYGMCECEHKDDCQTCEFAFPRRMQELGLEWWDFNV